MEEKQDTGWQGDVKRWVHAAAVGIEDQVERRWRRLSARLGLRQARSIHAYHGWANGEWARCQARVLANKLAGGPDEDDTWWDNLGNTYRRWHSREVPGVRVAAALQDQISEAESDEEGFVAFEWELTEPLGRSYWQEAALRVVGEKGDDEVVARCGILRPADDAAFGIISDVDDTILETGITNLLTAARLTFLNNAKTRKPLAGVAALYRALNRGSLAPDAPPRNPLFYISSSAWNLYDLISDFIDLNDIPVGPILLQDVGISQNAFISAGHGHKLEKARRIMDDYPALPFVLFGDSGQADAALYAQAARERPDQVRVIFIRDVDPARATERDAGVREHIASASEVGVPMYLVRDSVEAAERAVGLGLLPRDAVAGVRRETERDRRRGWGEG